jgi:hypothetical protein
VLPGARRSPAGDAYLTLQLRPRPVGETAAGLLRHRAVHHDVGAPVVEPVPQEAAPRGVIEKAAHGQRPVHMGIAGVGLEEVDDDNGGAPLELIEEGEGVVEVLDYVEGERSVEPAGNLGIKVVHRRVDRPRL